MLSKSGRGSLEVPGLFVEQRPLTLPSPARGEGGGAFVGLTMFRSGTYNYQSFLSAGLNRSPESLQRH
jgi:hypothetical protein